MVQLVIEAWLYSKRKKKGIDLRKCIESTIQHNFIKNLCMKGKRCERVLNETERHCHSRCHLLSQIRA